MFACLRRLILALTSIFAGLGRVPLVGLEPTTRLEGNRYPRSSRAQRTSSAALYRRLRSVRAHNLRTRPCRRTHRPLILALPALGLVALACKPEPTAGSVNLTGDSVTVQALLAGSGAAGEPTDLDVYAGLGWRLDSAGTDSDGNPRPTPQEHLTAQVYDETDPRPQVLVTAFGINDSAPMHGGWDWDDVARFAEHLDTPHPESCVVVVLPGYGDGTSAEHATELDRARADIASLADGREGPTVVVDWQTVVDEDPTVLDDDGIHLAKAETPEDDGGYGISERAAEERLGLGWEGVAQCP